MEITDEMVERFDHIYMTKGNSTRAALEAALNPPLTLEEWIERELPDGKIYMTPAYRQLIVDELRQLTPQEIRDLGIGSAGE